MEIASGAISAYSFGPKIPLRNNMPQRFTQREAGFSLSMRTKK